MRKRSLLCLLVCAVAYFLALGITAFAQGDLATVTGRVFDPNAAVIVEATVPARNVDTGIETVVHTNEDGIYRFVDLGPGNYEFSISERGFKVTVRPEVTLHVANTVSMNFTVEVGAVNETVRVEGGAPLVNTESAAVSTVVDQTYVKNVPLNGCSFKGLIPLSPGGVTSRPQSTGSGGVDQQGEFSVNGQRTESNVYTVDGVSANVGINPGFVLLPSTQSAQNVRNPGCQLSFVTRSGANQWRGTAFDYLQNNFFDPNDWFNDYLGKSEPSLRHNDFGGTLGGPFRIPRVHHGSDKTFFFFSYEGLRLRRSQTRRVLGITPSLIVVGREPPLQARTGAAQHFGAFLRSGSLIPVNTMQESAHTPCLVLGFVTTFRSATTLAANETLSEAEIQPLDKKWTLTLNWRDVLELIITSLTILSLVWGFRTKRKYNAALKGESLKTAAHEFQKMSRMVIEVETCARKAEWERGIELVKELVVSLAEASGTLSDMLEPADNDRLEAARSELRAVEKLFCLATGSTLTPQQLEETRRHCMNSAIYLAQIAGSLKRPSELR